jgi:Tol biopolymer transport system component
MNILFFYKSFSRFSKKQANAVIKAAALLLSACFSIAVSAVDNVIETQDWQIFETEHFRVHYTPEYRDWAIASAHEMEAAQRVVLAQQGRELAEKADVIVFDPLNLSNGYAEPVTHNPFMALYAAPPQSDSIIGNSDSWQQLLALHEYVHLVHLSQPQRNPVRRIAGELFDWFDVSDAITHRWVAEGYATLLESKMTGRGRLYNNQVEAILKQFAREGALPTYGQLNATSGRFMAGSLAYLMGVRYLAWLEEKYGEDTLDSVWTRMVAVKERNFETAFRGVFGKPASQLYKRFVAEYTYQALDEEKGFAENPSKLWLDTTGNALDPSLSPDGELLALVQVNQDGEAMLYVYSTDENKIAKDKFEMNQKRLLLSDPEDIADKPPEVFKRKVKYKLRQTNERRMFNPRWVNNDSLVYTALNKDSNNHLHQDLYLWELKKGAVTRLSTEQNIRRFDVNRTDRTIIAERNQYGKSQLIKLNIDTKAIEDITPPSLDIVYDFPRVRPGNTEQVAVLSTELNESWQLSVIDLSNNQQQTIPAPTGYQFLSYPEWSADGQSLYYVAGLNERLNIYRYDFNSQALEQLTQGQQAFSWPMPTPDNNLLHLAVNSLGPDVHEVSLEEALISQVAHVTQSAELAFENTYEHQLPPATNNLSTEIGEEREYGIGKQRITGTISGNFSSPSANLLEVGLKGGDLLQRFDWQLSYSQDVSQNALSGFAVGARWQAWPVKFRTQIYDFKLEPFKQHDRVALEQQNLDGIFLEASYPFILGELRVTPAIQRHSQELNQTDIDYWSALVKQSWRLNNQNWGLRQRLRWQWLDGENETFNTDGSNVDSSWQGINGEALFGGHWQKTSFDVSTRWARRFDSDTDLINFGGFESTLLNANVQGNIVFSPEIAFFNQQTNDYRYYQAAFSYTEAPIYGFYGRHKLAEDIDVYGFKGKTSFNRSVNGLSDVIVEFGIVQVNPEFDESSTEGWLGLYYQF